MVSAAAFMSANSILFCYSLLHCHQVKYTVSNTVAIIHSSLYTEAKLSNITKAQLMN